MNDVIDFDIIELEFEEFSICLPKDIIEKFQVKKVEQLIEKKYKPEEYYNIYIVINRIFSENLWQEQITKKFNSIANSFSLGHLIDVNGKPYYNSITDCINSNSIYFVNIYKNKSLIKKYSPVWTYTEFNNDYQRIGITEDKIIIHIEEI